MCPFVLFLLAIVLSALHRLIFNLFVLIQQTRLQFNDETDNLKQTYEKFEDTKALSEAINR
jgi:hypothetical protein